MHRGIKVRHKYFDEDEWMTIECDLLVFEDGVTTTLEEFFKYRQSDGWEDGYSFFNNDEYCKLTLKK